MSNTTDTQPGAAAQPAPDADTPDALDVSPPESPDTSGEPLTTAPRDDAPDGEGAAEAVTPEAAAAEAVATEGPPAVAPRDDGAVLRALAELREEVRGVREVCAQTQERLVNVETVAGETAKQVSFLPPQVRQLSGKVEGLNTSISESRYRAALLSLLGVYDLVDQVLRTLPAADGDEREAAHRRNYEVVRTQLRQILDANGLSEIAADGAFDPTVHRAAQRAPVSDPAQADMVLEVVRPGFRTGQSVLRYSEVVVGHYVPTPTQETVTETEEGSTIMPS